MILLLWRQKIFLLGVFIGCVRMFYVLLRWWKCILMYRGVLCDSNACFRHLTHSQTVWWSFWVTWNMCYFKNVAPVHMETHKENSAINWLMPGFRRTEYVIWTYVFVHFACCRVFVFLLPWRYFFLTIALSSYCSQMSFGSNLIVLPLFSEVRRHCWEGRRSLYRPAGSIVLGFYICQPEGGAFPYQAPNRCKVVSFRFPPSKCRNFSVAFVPLLPANHISPFSPGLRRCH